MTTNKMTLESLSNELFIDLFEFFNSIDLFRSFHNLNQRFNSLLFTYFRTYRIDFRSISKDDCNIFCRKFLPSITNQTIYLRLSDDDDTPYQCSYLQTLGLTFGLFENLRSLTFYELSSDEKINKSFFIDLRHLQNLEYLRFIDCRLFHITSEDFQDVNNQIWSLPKLIYCYWDIKHKGSYFYTPSYVSISLQYLTILQCNWSACQFPDLFDKTPNLRNFSTSFNTYEEDDLPMSYTFIPSPKSLSIKKLILTEVREKRLMINLFQLLPNLNHLKIYTYIKLNGDRWKEIILSYLPKLTVLQFMMNISLSGSINEQDNEKKVEKYVNTYRSSFWIDDHQWFIRCHWEGKGRHLPLCLYSLPYKFNSLPLDNTSTYRTISTCPSHMNFSFDSITNIDYDPSFFDDQILPHVSFVNINILNVRLPFDHRFFSIIPNLANLFSLNITIPSIDYQSQLQTLLDSAPRLFSLQFNSWATSIMPPYQRTSPSIRRLNVHAFNKSSRQHLKYDKKQCLSLSESPLGRQCRVLIIEVQEAISIVNLIHSMDNLRTLEVAFELDQRGKKPDLLEQLQTYLPSTWIPTRSSYGYFIIRS